MTGIPSSVLWTVIAVCVVLSVIAGAVLVDWIGHDGYGFDDDEVCAPSSLASGARREGGMAADRPARVGGRSPSRHESRRARIRRAHAVVVPKSGAE